MDRFFKDEDFVDDVIVITGQDAKHISKVLRLKVSDSVIICNTRLTDYVCKIISLDEHQVVLRRIDSFQNEAEPNIKIVLYQGLPKGDKFDYIIEKCVELGACEIIPLSLIRCVVKIDEKSMPKKLERWGKIAKAAAHQSGRGIIPQIMKVHTLDEAIAHSKKLDTVLCPYECETKVNIKDTLCENKQAKSIGFFIGPEGGFDLSEIEKIKNANINTVTLGKRILRTETAGVFVLSNIIYEFECQKGMVLND